MAFANGIGGYFVPGLLGAGTPQEQADDRWTDEQAAAAGGYTWGIDLPYGRASNYLATQRTPLTDNELNLLRSDIKDLLSDSRCKEFITAVLAQLNATGNSAYETTDVETIFNNVLGNGGISKGDLTKDRLAETFTSIDRGVGGKIVRHHVGITFDQSRGFSNYSTTHFNVATRGGTIIHELIHAASFTTYHHPDMAQAARSVALALGYNNVKDLPLKNDYSTYEGFDTASSHYFGDLFWQACYRGPTGKR
jgi:hypothetical protein